MSNLIHLYHADTLWSVLARLKEGETVYSSSKGEEILKAEKNPIGKVEKFAAEKFYFFKEKTLIKYNKIETGKRIINCLSQQMSRSEDLLSKKKTKWLKTPSFYPSGTQPKKLIDALKILKEFELNTELKNDSFADLFCSLLKEEDALNLEKTWEMYTLAKVVDEKRDDFIRKNSLEAPKEMRLIDLTNYIEAEVQRDKDMIFNLTKSVMEDYKFHVTSELHRMEMYGNVVKLIFDELDNQKEGSLEGLKLQDHFWEDLKKISERMGALAVDGGYSEQSAHFLFGL